VRGPRPAVERVCAVAAVEEIVAAEALKLIVSIKADEAIGVFAADESVGPRVAEEVLDVHEAVGSETGRLPMLRSAAKERMPNQRTPSRPGPPHDFCFQGETVLNCE
jgi:hypothetical protein